MNEINLKPRNLYNKLWDIHSDNKIPGTLYDNNQLKTIPVVANLNKIRRSLRNNNSLFKVCLDGKEFLGEMKSIKKDAATDEIISFSISQVPNDKNIDLNVSIKLKGEPKGISKGAIFYQIKNTLVVNGKISEVPSSVSIDVSKVDIGDKITVADLNLDNFDTECESSEVVAICSLPNIAIGTGTDYRASFSRIKQRA